MFVYVINGYRRSESEINVGLVLVLKANVTSGVVGYKMYAAVLYN